MYKIIFLILISTLLFSCGKTKEEIAKEEARKQDSINSLIEEAKKEAVEKAKKEAAYLLKKARDISNPGEKFVRLIHTYAKEKKANGSNWDIFSGKPDIVVLFKLDNKLIIRTPEKSNHYRAIWKNIEGKGLFRKNSWIKVEVWDSDDDSDHDLIGDWEGDFEEFINKIKRNRFSFGRVLDIKFELENILK